MIISILIPTQFPLEPSNRASFSQLHILMVSFCFNNPLSPITTVYMVWEWAIHGSMSN